MPTELPRSRMPRPPYLPITRRRAVLVAAALALNLPLGCACPRPATRTPNEPARAAPTRAALPLTSSTPSARPTLLPVSELAQLDLEPRVGAYLARDAVWVPGQPLAVNRDFDFALAMSLEGGLGAGLAAKKRQDDNRALAEKLAALPKIDTAAMLDALCVAAPRVCEKRAGKSVRIYGLLFGAEEARLLVVLEDERAPGQLALYGVVTSASPVAALADSDLLGRLMSAAAPEIALTMTTPTAPSNDAAICKLTPGANLEGSVVSETSGGARLLTVGRTTLLACPSDAFEPESADRPATPPASPSH